MKLNEAIDYIKFTYANSKNNKRPKVIVLDKDYSGRRNQKSFGNRKDILGLNINYSNNKKYTLQALKDIMDFADLLGERGKKNRFERIENFFPQYRDLIRRYNKQHIKNLRIKKGNRWKRSKI